MGEPNLSGVEKWGGASKISCQPNSLCVAASKTLTGLHTMAAHAAFSIAFTPWQPMPCSGLDTEPETDSLPSPRRNFTLKIHRDKISGKVYQWIVFPEMRAGALYDPAARTWTPLDPLGGLIGD